MSAFCGRWPQCGCAGAYGTKCHLPSPHDVEQRVDIDHSPDGKPIGVSIVGSDKSLVSEATDARLIHDLVKPTRAWVGNVYRDLTQREMQLLKQDKYTLKTNSHSEYVFIKNPSYRKSTTNLTPPKKKRKKR